MTVFARTDITSLMMRFVERGHTETCFSFDFTFLNRPANVFGIFLLEMKHFVTFCMHFFIPFPFQHITFIGTFAKQIFYEIVLPAIFNPGS